MTKTSAARIGMFSFPLQAGVPKSIALNRYSAQYASVGRKPDRTSGRESVTSVPDYGWGGRWYALSARLPWRQEITQMPRRILVVDDDPLLAKVTATALRAGGYEVTTINDGSLAMGEIASFKPDVVITDLMM